jgi:hypothetical protein
MNADNRIFAALVTVAAGAVLVPNVAACAETDLPAASVYYPLVGHWKGTGEMDQPGAEPTMLSLAISCVKASSGWAVSCEMVGKNKDTTVTESDLFGVDPVTGQGHWYTVSNQGETHDHLATWKGAKTLTAEYSWTQDGKKMLEHLIITLPAENSMEFNGVTTADGQPAGGFSGKLTR